MVGEVADEARGGMEDPFESWAREGGKKGKRVNGSDGKEAKGWETETGEEGVEEAAEVSEVKALSLALELVLV